MLFSLDIRGLRWQQKLHLGYSNCPETSWSGGEIQKKEDCNRVVWHTLLVLVMTNYFCFF